MRKCKCSGGLIAKPGLALPNRDIARYCIAPFLMRSDSVTYMQAAEARESHRADECYRGGGFRSYGRLIADGRPVFTLRIRVGGAGFLARIHRLNAVAWPQSALCLRKEVLEGENRYRIRGDSPFLAGAWSERFGNRKLEDSHILRQFGLAISDLETEVVNRAERTTGRRETSGKFPRHAAIATKRANRIATNHWPPAHGDLE